MGLHTEGSNMTVNDSLFLSETRTDCWQDQNVLWVPCDVYISVVCVCVVLMRWPVCGTAALYLSWASMGILWRWSHATDRRSSAAARHTFSCSTWSASQWVCHTVCGNHDLFVLMKYVTVEGLNSLITGTSSLICSASVGNTSTINSMGSYNDYNGVCFCCEYQEGESSIINEGQHN